MKIGNAAAAGRRSGLTLIEVLATVFVLGMGLIMVGAAFPVGIDQMRRTKEDTQAAELARSALNMIRAQGFAQLAAVTIPATMSPGFYYVAGSVNSMMPDMSNPPTVNQQYGLAVYDPSSPTAMSNSWNSDLVSNPNVLAYGSSSAYLSTNVIGATIANNTLVCIPVLTRMVAPAAMANGAGTRVECAGVPLYRVTLVVVKKTGQMDVNGKALPFYYRGYASAAGTNGITITAGNQAADVNVDDGVLVSYGTPTVNNKIDYRTGYVYRVVDVPAVGSTTTTATLNLDENPGLTGNTDCLVFFNFVAAYYAYIGG